METDENMATQLKKTMDQDADNPAIAPRLDSEGQRAAGWLSEKISSIDSTDAVSVSNPVRSTGGVSTMGDAILRGMQSASQNYKKISAEIHDSLSENTGQNLSLKGALELHMKFIEISMEAEVVSRVVSKSTQHVDQLSKLQ